MVILLVSSSHQAQLLNAILCHFSFCIYLYPSNNFIEIGNSPPKREYSISRNPAFLTKKRIMSVFVLKLNLVNFNKITKKFLFIEARY